MPLISWHDCDIDAPEMAILGSPTAWLNDRVLQFALEWMRCGSDQASRVAVLEPAQVSFLVHQCDEEDYADFRAGAGVDGKEMVLLLVCNDADLTVGGGSHWSLLVYRTAGPSFEHYDSAGTSNAAAAGVRAAKLWRVLGRPAASCPPVQARTTPQQTNGHDCGLHALGSAEAVLRGGPPASGAPVAVARHELFGILSDLIAGVPEPAARERAQAAATPAA